MHDLAAAFALDALDGDEVDEFEQHLAICPDCEDELARLRVAAVALAFAGELAVPPPSLRERVLDVGVPVIHLRRRRPHLAAAVAVVAAAVIAIAVRPWDDDDSIGGMKRFTAQGARATLLVDRSGEAVLAVRRLPPPPAGKAYEIWVIAGGKATPAGWVRGSFAALARPVPPGASVAVSIEPTAGSPQPTGALVLRAETT